MIFTLFPYPIASDRSTFLRLAHFGGLRPTQRRAIQRARSGRPARGRLLRVSSSGRPYLSRTTAVEASAAVSPMNSPASNVNSSGVESEERPHRPVVERRSHFGQRVTEDFRPRSDITAYDSRRVALVFRSIRTSAGSLVCLVHPNRSLSSASGYQAAIVGLIAQAAIQATQGSSVARTGFRRRIRVRLRFGKLARISSWFLRCGIVLPIFRIRPNLQRRAFSTSAMMSD